MRDLLRAGIMVCALAGLSTTSRAATTQTYQGNGGAGFGGAIGNSVLTVSDSGSGIINFSLTTGVPFSGNDLVLYIDSKTGGVNNNSTFTDNGDGGREAVAGYNASNNASRALVTFPAGFGADFALSIEPNVFAGLFNLSTPSNFGFVASANLNGSGSGPFTFSLNRSDLGLGPTDPFSFVGTLISTTAYRSNETIGTSVTTPGMPSDTPNAGSTGTQTFATASTFAVPEPSGIVIAGLVGAAGLLRRRRA